MTWFKALGIGVLNAILGLFGVGLIAVLCVDWYRVPSREGADGFFVVFLALLGAMGGFLIGLLAALLLLFKRKAGFLIALGLTIGSTILLLAIITGVAWLAADLPPKIEGKKLVLEFEVRMPASFAPAVSDDFNHAYAMVTRDHGDRASRVGPLSFKEARSENGSLIVPATVFLHTSDSGKSLALGVGDRPVQYYNLPVPGRPTRREMEWSDWMPGPTFGDVDKIHPEERMAVRYRVQFYVPPVVEPVPTRAELDAQAEAADQAALAELPADAPIGDWLQFTHSSKSEAVRQRATELIAARPNVGPELAEEMRSDDREQADRALRFLVLMKTIPPDLTSAVEEVGGEVLADLRIVTATSVEDDPGYERAAAAYTRFVGWHEAARVLHGHNGANFLPLMREILGAARVRDDSIVMRDVVRISHFYVDKWSPDDRD